jgi:hypothetical protein
VWIDYLNEKKKIVQLPEMETGKLLGEAEL